MCCPTDPKAFTLLMDTNLPCRIAIAFSASATSSYINTAAQLVPQQQLVEVCTQGRPLYTFVCITKDTA